MSRHNTCVAEMQYFYYSNVRYRSSYWWLSWTQVNLRPPWTICSVSKIRNMDKQKLLYMNASQIELDLRLYHRVLEPAVKRPIAILGISYHRRRHISLLRSQVLRPIRWRYLQKLVRRRRVDAHMVGSQVLCPQPGDPDYLLCKSTFLAWIYFVTYFSFIDSDASDRLQHCSVLQVANILLTCRQNWYQDVPPSQRKPYILPYKRNTEDAW